MIKNFFNKHIWPFSAIHARELALEQQLTIIKEREKSIDELRGDIGKLTVFAATNMISLKAIQTENDRPIKIAYASGLAKVTLEAATEKKGAFANVTYITSEPVAYHIRESLDTLMLHNKFTRVALKDKLRRAMANQIIDQSYDLVKSMIFDEEIPEE